MLRDIFLFKGKKDLEDLNIYCYPKEIINTNNKTLVNNIIKGHDQEKITDNEITPSSCETANHFKIDTPIAQYINDFNIYTSCINEEIIVGLIFEDEDNPYDYKEIFEELLCELLNNGNGYSFDEEMEIDNLLISMFIDLRRYGDEVVEKTPEIEHYFQRDAFFKVFLFGIDNSGKSSLVRLLKTGEFNENFFTPTRKFEIEYIEEYGGLLAIWDMPGQLGFRSRWLKGLQDSNILVYMLDIANQRRFEEAKKEFWNILNSNELDAVPLLILGNKSDLVKQSDAQLQNLREEVFNYFEFDRIKNRDWKFLFTSVKTNHNIESTVQTIFDLMAD
ncbi:MAG: GTP-binding protein [Candidatus Lokiarchaeota archaeon]|nr:GTP-binding protein [Candidatus Lokiarchaeota archaeon]